MIGKYVICRTYSAGVHAGILKEKNGKEATLTDSRRLWYWDGASSLSELAQRGTSRPDNCKFPCPVDQIDLTEVIEYLKCTDVAEKSIREVKEWTQH